ncbi:hypothetical protein Droror1_Dr00022504 [Drosera rotundifolia]
MEVDRAVALAQMKQAVQDLGSCADDCEDGMLLRFLLARPMAPEKAAKMFVQWQAWRTSMVPSGSITEDEVRDQLDVRRVFLGGLTKEGYRVVVGKGKGRFPLKDRHQFKKFVIYMLDKAVVSVRTGGRETGNEKLVALLDLGQLSFKHVEGGVFITCFQIQQVIFRIS